MHYSKLVYDATSDDYGRMSPARLLSLMFEKTDNDGNMYINKWPYDNDSLAEHTERAYKCHMNWTRRDFNIYAANFEALYKSIAEFAKEGAIKADADFSYANQEPRNKKYLKTWSTYIKPLSVAQDFRVELLPGTSLEPTNPKESFYDGANAKVMLLESGNRLKKSFKAYEVIMHARRLFRLIEISAPDCIVDHEARMLAETLAVNMFCDSLEVEPVQRF